MNGLLPRTRRTTVGALTASLVFVNVMAAEAVSIDGSSDSTFQLTHDQLLKSLAPEDRLPFVLAEVIYLSQFPCSANREPIANSEFLTKVLGGQTSLKACRSELNGQNFSSIMRLAYPPDGRPPKANAAAPPQRPASPVGIAK